MKTKGDARAYFLNIIDEATKKGIAVSDTKNADYQVKFDEFLDTAQKYVANTIKIPDVYTFTQTPIDTINDDGFDSEQILPDNSKVITLTGCKSFYLEVDNVCTITTSINGSVTDTISNTVKGSYTAYRRLTGATSTDTVVITCSSSYPFNIRNIGCFAYAFPLEADIPAYTPYVSYDMPSDFLEFDSLIIKTDPYIYQSYVNKKWENNKKVIIDYNASGSFDIHYYKYPTTIATDAADTVELEIEDKAFDLVALQVAILATAADNVALSGWLRYLYLEKIQNTVEMDHPIMDRVQTVFSIG